MTLDAEPVVLRLAEPSPAKIAKLRAWLTAIDHGARSIPTAGRVNLLITPLGMTARGWLARQLQRRGVDIQGRRRLARWPRLSTAIRLRHRNGAAMRRAVLFETAWGMLFPRGEAEVWGIDGRFHRRLVADKPALRARLANLPVSFGRGREDRGVLHAFHVPDLGEVIRETRRLDAALEALDSRAGR